MINQFCKKNNFEQKRIYYETNETSASDLPHRRDSPMNSRFIDFSFNYYFEIFKNKFFILNNIKQDIALWYTYHKSVPNVHICMFIGSIQKNINK